MSLAASGLHCTLMIPMSVCASPFGAGMPNAGEHLGFNVTYKTHVPHRMRGGPNVGYVSSPVDRVHPK